MTFKNKRYKLLTVLVSLGTAFSLLTSPLTAFAITPEEEVEQNRLAAYNKTIESNQIEDWPLGPQIYANSAIIMEASTGTVLYEKDINAVSYPASITKIMTALVAIENSSLDDVITYSYYATHSIEAGSSSIGTTEGEELTVEQSLYALLLASANECGNGLAEHIAGSIEGFVEMMNQKALELGCTNTHFTNPHGLHDENHYTSAHDMALITQAALQNEDFVRICGTDRLEIPATNKDDEITYLINHHYMIAPYKGVHQYLDDTVIAGKTGYTSDSKLTLVTVAERNGMTLIVVTLRTENSPEGPSVFSDTQLLLDYATDNFNKINISANEQNFTLNNTNFFNLDSQIFGGTNALIELNPTGSIILPNTASFKDAAPTLNFDNLEDSNTVATLSYTYKDLPIGSTTIDLTDAPLSEFDFDVEITENVPSEDTTQKTNFIQINLKWLFIPLGILLGLLVLFILLRSVLKFFNLPFLDFMIPRRRKKRRHKSRRRRPRSSSRSSSRGSSSRSRYRRRPKNRD